MKKFNAGEWVLLMLAFSVGASILISVLGIVFKGGAAPPTEGAVAVRSAVIDLLKVITGGIFGAVATIMTIKKNELPKNNEHGIPDND